MSQFSRTYVVEELKFVQIWLSQVYQELDTEEVADRILQALASLIIKNYVC